MTNTKPDAAPDQDDRLRLQISATAAYIPDHDEADGPWCVEVGLHESEPEIQGWGPDPLAAAFDAAANAYESALRLREHYEGAHEQRLVGPLTCPECRHDFEALMRSAIRPASPETAAATPEGI